MIVDHLRHVFEKRTDVGVAAIFCNFQEQYRQKPTQLLAGIWRQLVQGSGTLTNSITLTYKTHRSRGTALRLQEISDELASTVDRLHRVFIVVDALDEASESDTRSVLLAELRQLLPRANILVTSRPLDDIRAEFHDSLQLEIAANIDDIARYIKARIQQEGRLRRHVERDPSLENIIVQEVSSKTRKMYVSCPRTSYYEPLKILAIVS
jgi:hypothetical protein